MYSPREAGFIGSGNIEPSTLTRRRPNTTSMWGNPKRATTWWERALRPTPTRQFPGGFEKPLAPYDPVRSGVELIIQGLLGEAANSASEATAGALARRMVQPRINRQGIERTFPELKDRVQYCLFDEKNPACKPYVLDDPYKRGRYDLPREKLEMLEELEELPEDELKKLLPSLPKDRIENPALAPSGGEGLEIPYKGGQCPITYLGTSNGPNSGFGGTQNQWFIDGPLGGTRVASGGGTAGDGSPGFNFQVQNFRGEWTIASPVQLKQSEARQWKITALQAMFGGQDNCGDPAPIGDGKPLRLPPDVAPERYRNPPPIGSPLPAGMPSTPVREPFKIPPNIDLPNPNGLPTLPQTEPEPQSEPLSPVRPTKIPGKTVPPARNPQKTPNRPPLSPPIPIVPGRDNVPTIDIGPLQIPNIQGFFFPGLNPLNPGDIDIPELFEQLIPTAPKIPTQTARCIDPCKGKEGGEKFEGAMLFDAGCGEEGREFVATIEQAFQQVSYQIRAIQDVVCNLGNQGEYALMPITCPTDEDDAIILQTLEDALRHLSIQIREIKRDTCEFDPILSMPEIFAVKTGNQVPQLNVVSAINDEQKGRSRWNFTIPHPIFETREECLNSVLNGFTYNKGNYTLTIVLSDNSQSVFNLIDEGECNRVWTLMRTLIKPEFWVQEEPKWTKGARSGLRKVEVRTTQAQYYETSDRDVVPTWAVKFPW